MNTIAAGEAVFIGEEGLNITFALNGDREIGWWASGASIATSSPSYSMVVPDPVNFYVSPTDFGSRTGNWYRLPTNKTPVFNVVDPNLDVRIEDTTVSVDVTDKWVPSGDEMRFRINSNLVPISQRAGMASVPITIKVQGPDGAIYTSLVNKAGTTTSIVNIPVTTTPYYTGAIWWTDTSKYMPGTYVVWAECNVNRMMDNYGVTGKTISAQVTVLNQEQNPLIGGGTVKATTAATAVPATITTTLHATTKVVTTQPASPVPTEVIETATTPRPATPAQTTHTPGFTTISAIAALTACLAFTIRK
jgi:hypothetical protein